MSLKTISSISMVCITSNLYKFKEQIQKLAHQIEFMKTVHMQVNNRHLKPKPGGYFTITSTSFQAPFTKCPAMSSAHTQTANMQLTKPEEMRNETIIKRL